MSLGKYPPGKMGMPLRLTCFHAYQPHGERTSLAQNRGRKNQERDGAASGRIVTRQPEVDLIDRLSGIRTWLLRNCNRCEDRRLRDTIRDAEEQI